MLVISEYKKYCSLQTLRYPSSILQDGNYLLTITVPVSSVLIKTCKMRLLKSDAAQDFRHKTQVTSMFLR